MINTVYIASIILQLLTIGVKDGVIVTTKNEWSETQERQTQVNSNSQTLLRQGSLNTLCELAEKINNRRQKASLVGGPVNVI